MAWLEDGSAVVAASYEPRDAVYVFEEATSGEWQRTARLQVPTPGNQSFARVVRTHESRILVGAPSQASSLAAVYVFEQLADDWVQTQTLSAPPGLIRNFGGDLSADGDWLAVGATDPEASGSVHLYRWTEAGYEWQQVVQPLGGSLPQTSFGSRVSVVGSSLWISAEREAEDGSANGPGSVHFYQNVAGTWMQTGRELAPPGDQGLMLFGSTLARSASSPISLLGSPYADTSGTNAGLMRFRVTVSDCNGNGIPDRCDLQGGQSPDLDQDGRPDRCR